MYDSAANKESLSGKVKNSSSGADGPVRQYARRSHVQLVSVSKYVEVELIVVDIAARKPPPPQIVSVRHIAASLANALEVSNNARFMNHGASIALI